MQVNLPITPHEYVLAEGETLVSTTDTQGRITHCNQAFVRASGFDYEELLGQPHHLVRHPDMPPEAFKDMWSTIGRGRPWSGIVKNRRKNGDFYWVHANVTPVMERGKPKGYMSVRLKPSREQIRDAEALYARIATERDSGRARIRLHAGNVRPNGWLDLLGRVHRLTLAQRAGIGMGLVLALALSPTLFTAGLTATVGLQALAGLVGLGLFMAWFVRSVSIPINQADDLAGEVAGCDLDGSITYDTTSPLGSLMRRLWLVNLNMRAIVADVRAEVAGMTHATEDIHRGSQQLSARTEAQAAGVEQTSASLEQIAGTVQHTADTARELAGLSTEATDVAGEGGEAVERAAQCMSRIQTASQRINDIIEVMEGLAFQTNLLALNAAVEASHAGDHGRGFGVVAAEVRALAHRSRDAAHQIRDLIRASGEEVAQGTAAVDGAAQTIRRAVNSVRQVADRLNQITNATHEQSLGAAQISQAMQLLDDVTQQNSALAHQASRNCEALESRAGTLQRAVQIFTMKG